MSIMKEKKLCFDRELKWSGSRLGTYILDIFKIGPLIGG
jgi:hypothetical protein